MPGERPVFVLATCAMFALMLVPAPALADGAGPSDVDLVVREVSAEAGRREGESIQYSGVVTNDGSEQLASPFRVAYRVDGEVVVTQTFPGGLPPGGSIFVTTVTGAPPAGAHVLEIVVDAEDEVDETDESNNVGVADFEVAPSDLDLFVRDLSVREAYARTSIPLWVLAGNIGTQRPSSPVYLTWALDGVVFDQDLVETAVTAPGGEAWFSTMLPPVTEGSHEIRASIEPASPQRERTTANNSIVALVDFGPPPDFAAEILSLERVELRTPAGNVTHPLQRWSLITRLCERGGGQGMGDFGVRVEWGIGGSLMGADLPGAMPILAPATCSTYEHRFDSPATLGEFRVVARASVPYDSDPSNDVAIRAASNVASTGTGAGVGPPIFGAFHPLTEEHEDAAVSVVGELFGAVPSPHLRASSLPENMTAACETGTFIPVIGRGATDAPCRALFGDPAVSVVAPCRRLDRFDQAPSSTGYALQERYNAAHPFRDRPPCSPTAMTILNATAADLDARLGR